MRYSVIIAAAYHSFGSTDILHFSLNQSLAIFLPSSHSLSRSTVRNTPTELLWTPTTRTSTKPHFIGQTRRSSASLRPLPARSSDNPPSQSGDTHGFLRKLQAPVTINGVASAYAKLSLSGVLPDALTQSAHISIHFRVSPRSRQSGKTSPHSIHCIPSYSISAKNGNPLRSCPSSWVWH